MARDPASAPKPIFAHPWFLILTGLAITALSWLGAGFEIFPAFLRVLMLVTGFFLSVTGVMLRLHQTGWDLLDRIESGAMIAATGTGCLLAWMSMNRDWESGRMLFGALFLASLGAVVLVLLPTLLRKVALSLLLVFHFGGMVTAITSVDPPGSSGPWVSKQLWMHVYRPYLSFLYMTNAYHFYSPDPGPPALLWFAVKYDDDSTTWVKLPARDNSPVGMHYQRLLALPEHTFTPLPRLPFSSSELAMFRASDKEGKFVMPVRGSWEDIYMRRQLGSTRQYPAILVRDGQKVEEAMPIPMIIDTSMNVGTQYREPTEPSKRLLSSVARRIFWTAPPSPNGAKIKSVKVYRVVQQIILPSELAKGGNFMEKTRYWPYFLGEYNGLGELIDPNDPFLYWYIPILNVSPKYPSDAHMAAVNVPAARYGDPPTKDTMVLDCLEMHAAGEIRKKANQPNKGDKP